MCLTHFYKHPTSVHSYFMGNHTSKIFLFWSKKFSNHKKPRRLDTLNAIGENLAMMSKLNTTGTMWGVSCKTKGFYWPAKR